ncbi:hypothetical protein [Streptomyces achromogenes]|uniref:hypothetical protein n=1 Tax=Streptomyces achromogenes TaxID=67255 RepID=UPI0012FF4018|nr:hypothetical protein [Streptomyces achromogenes]
MSRGSNGAVDAGVFVAAFVLLLVSIAKGWPVLPWVFGAVLIGVMVTTAARRQRTGGRTQEPGERPWRR